MLLFQGAWAQVSTGNNSPFAGDYVGCDGGTLFPLDIRHNGNYPIEFYTDSIGRMHLTESIPAGTINGYTVNQSGHLGIGAFADPAVSNPFTLLHLDWGGDQNTGFRSWMKAGTYITDHSDMMYVGTKPRGGGPNDRNDAVINWADNLETNPNFGPDVLKFIFTRDNDSTNAASSHDGLEIARMVPDTSGNEGFLGVGDWLTAGVQPNERLDVLDRTLRLRRLVPDYRNDTLSRILVTDTTGRVHWRPVGSLPSSPGGAGCEWEPNAGTNSVYTAWRPVSSNGSCPEVDWKTGIGLNNPLYKLDVKHNETSGSMPGGLNVVFTPDATNDAHGIRSEVLAPTGSEPQDMYGMWTKTKNSTRFNYAVKAVAEQASVNANTTAAGHFVTENNGSSTVGTSYGIFTQCSEVTGASVGAMHGLHARAMGNKTNAYGVYGTAQSVFDPDQPNRKAYGVFGLGKGGAASYGVYGQADQNGATDYGVYGNANGTGANTTNCGVRGRAVGGNANYSVFGELASGGATNWSGFFVGSISAAGVAFPSDQNLKTDIQDLQSPMDLLMQLRPKSYNYRLDQYPQMGLPTGLRYGFIAQEVQEAFPQFVSPSHQPATTDTLGNEVAPAVDYLALSTADIIPILVGAVQEQHTGNTLQAEEMNELRHRVEQLEQLLAACCANPDRALPQPGSDTGIINDAAPGMEKLRIQPNPFNERTTVYYKLDNGGRTQLMANSADGKELRVLHEATLEKGDYQYEWNTAALAPGMYYVTLLVDGQPVVKKAV